MSIDCHVGLCPPRNDESKVPSLRVYFYIPEDRVGTDITQARVYFYIPEDRVGTDIAQARVYFYIPEDRVGTDITQARVYFYVPANTAYLTTLFPGSEATVVIHLCRVIDCHVGLCPPRNDESKVSSLRVYFYIPANREEKTTTQARDSVRATCYHRDPSLLPGWHYYLFSTHY